MGSLVPGWDADLLGLPPKDLQEHDDLPSDQGGYFQRLERSRTLRKTGSLGAAEDTPVLRRAHSERVDSLTPSSATAAAAAGSRTLFSSKTMQRTSVSGTSAPKAFAYHATNWETELRSLQPRLARASIDSHRTSSCGTPAGTPAGGGAGWWSQLDAAALNRSPRRDAHTRAEDSPSTAPGLARTSVKLGFDVTGTSLGTSLMPVVATM